MKKLTAMLLTLMMVLSLAACSNTGSEFSQHKEAAQAFIEFCTLNDETSQWWLEAYNGDVVNNKAVLDANSDYQNVITQFPELSVPADSPYYNG